jgi:hypothetical protein
MRYSPKVHEVNVTQHWSGLRAIFLLATQLHEVSGLAFVYLHNHITPLECDTTAK